MLKNEPGIYAIRNTTSGRLYVGSSTRIQERVQAHFSALRRDAHETPELQADFNQLGAEHFVGEVLEVITDVTRLQQFEQWWIDRYAEVPGRLYNRTLVVSRSTSTAGRAPLVVRLNEQEHAKVTRLSQAFGVSRAGVLRLLLLQADEPKGSTS